MGYTHYWNIQKEPSEKKFSEFSKACKKLHDALPETTDSAGGYYSENPIVIVNGLGEEGTNPEFDADCVYFNGVDDLGHETFMIDRTPGGNFCKTARKPYDLLVVACLIAASQMLETFTFSSDGFTDYYNEQHSVHVHECDDLIPGMNFYNEVMQPENPITETDLWEIRKIHHGRN